jgi:hypothetical protein
LKDLVDLVTAEVYFNNVNEVVSMQFAIALVQRYELRYISATQFTAETECLLERLVLLSLMVEGNAQGDQRRNSKPYPIRVGKRGDSCGRHKNDGGGKPTSPSGAIAIRFVLLHQTWRSPHEEVIPLRGACS